MGPIRWFLFVYVVGGLTFVPLLIVTLFLFAYYTLPPPADRPVPQPDDPAEIKRENDEKLAFRTGTDDLAEKFQRKHESDVAAGYFAVCREYVPGGVNGKPPDKLSPAGEVVATESPSVYQSMYRSIFDRSQKPTIEPNKDSTGKSVKKANNIFYVVLRHGHLMLYDDIQQLDVRYVISLEYHDVDVYGGGEEIPEGELWIKRNAIRLRRKPKQIGDKVTSLPFFLFSENLSDKEDFYFALLKNQEKSSDDMPTPQEFEVRHMVTLVQKLHSSEEHLQTRWLNAFIGRFFLAMYKTPEFENLIRQKLTKKISRVKKPNFITKLALQKIYAGEGAPFITNPRLKDLTVNGDCTAEFDMLYTGNFRIEIAATARIDLGTRFKAREVDMVLAATCKKLQGHALIRFKPAPSNRMWFTFEKMPTLDLTLEPIVSSRQITYNVILRAIESRVREVVAETIVLPFWDDFPFHSTAGEKYRGGIWKREVGGTPRTEIQDEDPEDEATAGGSGIQTPTELTKLTDERAMSTPVLVDTVKPSPEKRSVSSMNEILGTGGEKTSPAQPPRVLRSTSFASVANPMVTADHADVDASNKDVDTNQNRDRAASFLKDLSARSIVRSPAGSQSGSPPVDSTMIAAMKDRSDTLDSRGSRESVSALSMETSTPVTPSQNSFPTTPTRSTTNSKPSSLHEDPSKSKSFAQAARSLTAGDRKQTLASINAATQAAQKWGWGVLARNKQKEAQAAENAADSQSSGPASAPMGRGRPLPPPGMPLPPPEKTSAISNPFSLPKRKPIPPPLLPKRPDANGSNDVASMAAGSAKLPKPALPERRKRQSSMQSGVDDGDEVFVVEAPTESVPASPAAITHEHHDDFFGHGEDESGWEPGPAIEDHGDEGEEDEDEEEDDDDGQRQRVQQTQGAGGRPPPPPLPLRMRGESDDSTDQLTQTSSSETTSESVKTERNLAMLEAASGSSGYHE